ncbi:hypothetical protein BpHYR1_024556 [Brachionus plicatilis]|uniref:Uncharacterized protein n=1 Tax=Brachionus plicatilis TaxID=10195 RepID=A0A3M7PFX3_BRAPC|nr:hypothetical protein BpHYR1_024556 [Brachionus plicatilis]
MGKKNEFEAQRWQIISLLKDKTKSQQEIADLNYQGLVDPESLPVEMSRTFLERSESILQQAIDS